jgi:hypothetical protein
MELVPFTRALTSDGYRLLGRAKGVIVYRDPRSAIVQLAAEGSFAARPERVRAVLLDYGNHTRYIQNIAESRVLVRGRGSLLLYQRLRLPIISDRDYTLEVSWGADGKVLWLKFACANWRGPAERRSIVRVRTHEGGWQLQPIHGGSQTWARYQMRLDLGGSLPRWMARSGATSEIPALFEAVRGQAR